jgi:hypothetical protein
VRTCNRPALEPQLSKLSERHDAVLPVGEGSDRVVTWTIEGPYSVLSIVQSPIPRR